MAVNLEKELSKIENELKSLKATYNIYGGAMKSYISVSPVYTNTTGQITQAKIKFTPQFKANGNLIISSILYSIDYTQGVENLASWATIDIQDGSGSVVIEMPVFSNFSISVVATSPGTFTRIA